MTFPFRGQCSELSSTLLPCWPDYMHAALKILVHFVSKCFLEGQLKKESEGGRIMSEICTENGC